MRPYGETWISGLPSWEVNVDVGVSRQIPVVRVLSLDVLQCNLRVGRHKWWRCVGWRQRVIRGGGRGNLDHWRSVDDGEWNLDDRGSRLRDGRSGG